ncbi:MAG TPA: hypothetical protein VNX67_07490 [Solirubrobacteraceae bacterium]|jgi:hypothetical protein|nr:hypothetical protein [Solirubrobacteraceae bacterium]
MHVRFLPTTGSLVAVALVALAGCSKSSSNSITSKSAEQIVGESKAAADAASAVHVSGSLRSASVPVTLNLNLVAGKGAQGEISQNGASFKLILVGDTVYISGSPAFYRSLGGSAAAQLFKGKWLKASATSGEFASFKQLADMRRLIDTTLAVHGTLVKGATTTVNGQRVIAVADSTKDGTLYVATTGKPYPLQLSKGGAESGKIGFDNWDQPVAIAAPANAVDLSELKSLAGR